MIDLRTTGGAVPVEPLIELVSGHADKAPAIPVRKSTAAAPQPSGEAPQPVATADANLAGDAAAQRATLIIVNQSSVEVCYVYISPSDSDSWGDDWLGDDSIRPGRQRQFKIPAGEYDVRAEDCDGELLEEYRGVELSGKVEWTIENPDQDTDVDAETTDEEDTATEDNAAELEPVELTQYLCCGYTVGGTRIWGISYPEGWQVRYLPNGNPNDFVGAIFSNADDSIEVVYIPSAWTPMGTAMDTGNVDQYLDAYTLQRARTDPGYEEFLREPVAGFPMYRVWSGKWEHDGEQYFESYLVGVTEMPYVEGMPRGAINLMGPRGTASRWQQAKSIYNAMLATAQVEIIGPGGYTPPPSGPSDSPEENSVAEEGGAATSFWETVFCPRACHWETIDLNNQPAGRVWCCSDDCVGLLSEVPCTEDQCNPGCASY